MKNTKFLVSLILTVSVMIGQVGGVLAAPVLQKSTTISGTVQSITLETDPNTGITTVILELTGTDQVQVVRISQNTAVAIGLIVLDGDGKPVINNLALGQSVEIDPATVIPDQQEDRHPVGNALSTFFADVPGLDYETIMTAHDEGSGFGVITQALWLTKQLGGSTEVFKDLLVAKQTGDYTAFIQEDGTVPKNWGQLRKAILDGKKLGKADGNTTSTQNNGNEQDKDKNKDKDKDKDKNKDKDKDKDNGGTGNDKDKDKDK